MKKEDFESKVSSMLDKIGNDSSNLILDDVGILLTDNENMNNELAKKDKEISDLKKRNETLQKVNGNLLQQVSVSSEEDRGKKEEIIESTKPYFDMRTIFDKNGNFIK